MVFAFLNGTMGHCDHKEAVKVERDVDGKVLQKWDASCVMRFEV